MKTIHLPDELHEELKNRASGTHRTLIGMIAFLLNPDDDRAGFSNIHTKLTPPKKLTP